MDSFNDVFLNEHKCVKMKINARKYLYYCYWFSLIIDNRIVN